jgi:catechol 2,3-dioxygenase
MTQRSHNALGPVTLVIRDIQICGVYYRDQIGLQLLESGDSVSVLGAGGKALLVLEANPSAAEVAHSTGLYHMAFLLPHRAALANQLKYFADEDVRVAGMSDHLVSEALYLHDPEGNGIEIYRDRHPDEWRWKGGEVEMTTLPLDVDNVMAALTPGMQWNGMDEDAVMGHVHLRVADLASSEAFYRDVIGLEVTTRSYPGALFLAKGSYHHHIGLNTWRSAGAPALPTGAPGLKHFELRPEDDAAYQGIKTRATTSGIIVEDDDDGIFLTDPSGIRVFLRRP